MNIVHHHKRDILLLYELSEFKINAVFVNQCRKLRLKLNNKWFKNMEEIILKKIYIFRKDKVI